MPYISDEPEITKPPVTRPVKEFLSDFKKTKLSEEQKPSEELMVFLDWLIANVNDGAKINQRQEKEISRGIIWDWWSADGESMWYAFLQLMDTMPQ